VKLVPLNTHVNRFLSAPHEIDPSCKHIFGLAPFFTHFQSQKPPLLPKAIKEMNTVTITIATMEKQFNENM